MHLPYGDVSWDTEDFSPTATDHSSVPAGARPLRSGSGGALPTIRLMGVRFHAVTERQAIEHILRELDAGNGGFVVTPNLDHLRRYRSDVPFAALISEASLVLADGTPVVWASRLAGTPLPERVAGSDLISSLSSAAAEAGRSVFLLGGAPGTADAAAAVLVGRHPTLKIVGTACPPMGFEDDPAEMLKLIEQLRAAKPDIVFVALGSPKQEFLIDRIGRTLPQTWWLGVGISLSFLCGEVKRAPRWLQRCGLEWTHRLVQEPRRLFKRYILVGLPFATRLFGHAVKERLLRKVGLRRDLEARTPTTPVAPPRVERVVGPETTTATRLARSTRERVLDPLHITVRADAAPSSSSLRRLRALVLLGGSVRATEFSQAIGRSVLDLPLDERGSVLNNWLAHADELAKYAGLASLLTRVTVNRGAFEPGSASPRYNGLYSVENDSSEYRGTGGILRDLAEHYDEQDYILVANAAQVLLDPLSAIAAALDRRHADVSLIAHRDGTPSGLMLLRCGALRQISPVGFIDMKEQALPEIASRFDVRAVQTRRTTGLSVRGMSDYLSALRVLHRRGQRQDERNPLEEDYSKSFAIVEAGASVDPTAYVHDSVVLRGARLEPGCAVVRTVVCPAAVVTANEQVMDRLVKPSH